MTFLLAANPGEAARPLARAASGGELSRAMLAARVVLSEAPPTLVFDEVDAGIGGEAGVAVGRLLQTLGSRHQVLCVTHLAQVAAFAGTQVVVEKAVEQVVAARQDGRSGRWRPRRSSTATRASPSCRACSRASATPSHARRHAAELLETAGACRSGAAVAGQSAALMARLLRRKTQPETFAVQGVARVDRRTKDMIPRLQAGEIAVINHRDLDRVAADGLIETGVVAVVNCAESISGRYPNGGPIRVVERGHHRCSTTSGVELMDRVHEGDVVRIERRRDLAQRRAARPRARCSTTPSIEAAMEDARARPSAPSSSASPRTRSSTSRRRRGSPSSR